MKFTPHTKKTFVYYILFNFPRTILSVMDDIVYILSFGMVCANLYWKGVEQHMRWAIGIASKFKTKKDDDI